MKYLYGNPGIFFNYIESFQNNNKFVQQKIVEINIKHSGMGFELTASWTFLSSHDQGYAQIT